MHFHPILLIQADSLEEAKSIAKDFCGSECGEHSWFDYGGVAADEETAWNKPLAEVWDKLPPARHIEDARCFIAKAGTELDKQNYGMAGYYYHKAGLLLQERFCTESPVFNIQYNDYSRVHEKGWYAVEADLHC
jgi:hypothetical protein